LEKDSDMDKSWRQYEKQVYNEFKERYPNQSIDFDQKRAGRYSLVDRQIDILITAAIADSVQIGVFDCKRFNSKIDVKAVDSMIGYMDDLNANYGGIISCRGFSKAAYNRARSGNIKLKVIQFESPKELVGHFVPSLDFSDPRNSMYYLLPF
jgi:hypothetical protein